MTISLQDIDYSSLSSSERLLLAAELVQSVLAESQPLLLTRRQIDEMHRRAAAIDAGRIKCIPWEVFEKRLLSRQ